MTLKNTPPPSRKPRAFVVDEPDTKAETPPRQKPATKPRKPSALPVTVAMTSQEDDPFALPAPTMEALTPPPAKPRKRGLTASKVLLASLGFLATLGIGLWTDNLIQNLFARLPWLGWLAMVATGLAAVALLIVVLKEVFGLRRLAKVASLRSQIAARGKSASSKEARGFGKQVIALVSANPLTARARKNLDDLDGEIIDGPHYLSFAERELMTPLDRQARQLILSAAKRVSVVTALSPRAFVDIAYVSYESAKLIRAMAELYGGRPGTFGMVRLFRDVIAHLALTGAIAAGDSLIQQVVGHGLAAKLSARLGEGVINGMMTTRIGISAMDLCRPMPFDALKRPGIGEFMADIAGFASKQANHEDDADNKK